MGPSFRCSAPRSSRRALAGAALLGALAGGCTFLEGPRKAQPDRNEPLFAGPIAGADESTEAMRAKIRRIDSMVQAFADRYAALVTGACDAILAKRKEPEIRLAIDRFQIRTVSAIYDIATNEDAYTKVLDLMVVVTLTANMAILEGYASDLLGDDAMLLAQPLQRGREDVDSIAAEVLRPDEQVELARLIGQWRDANPDIENLAFVRFNTFSESRGKNQIADARESSGLLAPISQAVDEVARGRLLAERAFYMAKRAPLLVSLESASIMSQLASMPELQKTLEIGEQVSQSADRLSAVAEQLPGQLDSSRDKLVESIERSSGVLSSTIGEYRRAVERTDELVGSIRGLSGSGKELVESLDSTAATLTTTLSAAERVAKVFVGDSPEVGPPHAPFDPEVYARMLVDIRGSLVELNAALDRSKALAEGGLWERPIAEFDRISKQRIEHTTTEVRSMIDLVYQRTLIILIAAFIGLVSYRVISLVLQRRLASSPTPSSPLARSSDS
jgi:hypothetical protein